MAHRNLKKQIFLSAYISSQTPEYEIEHFSLFTLFFLAEMPKTDFLTQGINNQLQSEKTDAFAPISVF